MSPSTLLIILMMLSLRDPTGQNLCNLLVWSRSPVVQLVQAFHSKILQKEQAKAQQSFHTSERWKKWKNSSKETILIPIRPTQEIWMIVISTSKQWISINNKNLMEWELLMLRRWRMKITQDLEIYSNQMTIFSIYQFRIMELKIRKVKRCPRRIRRYWLTLTLVKICTLQSRQYSPEEVAPTRR